MGEGTGATEERLDELYREHPDGFVAGRDRLAKELRAGGEREEAERVSKLRRPTEAAWLINRAALSSSGEIEEFADASRELESAQESALTSEEGAEAYRAAANRERQASDAVVDTVTAAGRDAGRPPTGRIIELVEETLRAASGDAELRETVRRGRLQRQQAAARLGTASSSAAASGRREARPEKRREVVRARRELRRLEKGLAAASEREDRLRTRVAEATEALEREQASLEESRREAADLRRRVEAAKRRVG